MDIGYARVSTGDQNLGLQLDALRKAGCDPILPETKSGKAGVERPVRDRILRDLEQSGVKFRSLTESIDTRSAQGRLFFVLLAAFAEFERNQIVERTKAGKQARIANGLHPGGPRTYGFATDRATVIEVEAVVLRNAAARILEGGSLARLVDSLNGLQVPAKRGGRWNETTLRRMLLNSDLVPAILTQRQHRDLVDLFANPAARQRQGRPATHLLSGILECACGAKMYATAVNSKGRRRMVYACRRSYGGRWNGCGKVSIGCDTVEEFITEAAAEAVTSEWFTEALNARRAAALEGVSAADLEAARAELADYQALPARFRTPETDARQVELQQRIRVATAKLTAIPELRELLDLPRTRASWEAAWSSWDVPARRRRLKLLLRKVTVKATGKGVRFHRSRLAPDWRV